ncbi:MAG: hemolysin III family protein [Flavobacteriaceae bacterium]
MKNEEFWNTVTHFAGVLLTIIGIPFLFYFSNEITIHSKLSLILFSIGLLLVYISSTLYHYAQNKQIKNKLRVFDHISIFYLILGSYAPVCLITLLESSGLIIFICVLILALTGTLIKIFFFEKSQFISLVLYVLMGWLIILDLNNLFQLISTEARLLLIASGFSYTLGVVFYYFDRIKYFHSIWHIFVLLGSTFHYLLVLLYVI